MEHRFSQFSMETGENTDSALASGSKMVLIRAAGKVEAPFFSEGKGGMSLSPGASLSSWLESV